MADTLVREHYYSPYFEDQEEHLPALPRLCGYENNVRPCEYDTRAWERPGPLRYFLQDSVSGAGELIRSGHSLRLDPGTSVLLPMPGNFRIRIHPEADSWEVFFISFQDPFSIRFLKRLSLEYGSVHRLPENSGTVQSLKMVFRLMREKPFPDEFRFSHAGYAFLMSLGSDLKTLSALENRSEPDLPTLAAQFCMENLSRQITVSELAAFCGYTRSHFSRLFHRAAGVSPSDFLLRFKMNMAARILADESVSVKELAARCGFEDPSHFSRVFKRCFHCTAHEFTGKRKGPSGKNAEGGSREDGERGGAERNIPRRNPLDFV